jgi:tRNA(fMet)-specific endonuclease VapC
MRYVVDTNILSALEGMPANKMVVEKIAIHQHEIALTSVNWHEIWYGYHRLPTSRRKDRVRNFLYRVEELALPILPYDEEAALWFAEERARLSLVGKTPAYADGQIAAITAVNNLILVTRNRADFRDFPSLHLENWFSD